MQPAIHNPVVIGAFGEAIIDIIQDRTITSHQDKNGTRFRKYSKVYADAKGVSRGNVDLLLTGEMHSDFKVAKIKPRLAEVEIGFSKGSLSEKKAISHIQGKGFNPIRDFYGASPAELIKALEAVIKEVA